jgi:hypothetical protein
MMDARKMGGIPQQILHVNVENKNVLLKSVSSRKESYAATVAKGVNIKEINKGDTGFVRFSHGTPYLVDYKKKEE